MTYIILYALLALLGSCLVLCVLLFISSEVRDMIYGVEDTGRGTVNNSNTGHSHPQFGEGAYSHGWL